MAEKKKAAKKSKKKAAPKYAAKKDVDALVERFEHLVAVLSNRLNFNVEDEPEDIIHSGAAAPVEEEASE